MVSLLSNSALGLNAHFDCVVHQAVGMITAQVDVSIPEAFLRLDEYCRSHDKSMGEVAKRIVDRQLTFAP